DLSGDARLATTALDPTILGRRDPAVRLRPLRSAGKYDQHLFAHRPGRVRPQPAAELPALVRYEHHRSGHLRPDRRRTAEITAHRYHRRPLREHPRRDRRID